MENKVIHNKEENRFEMSLGDNDIAFVSYLKNDNHLDLTYSEVPLHLRGKGIGKELVLKTFEQIEKEGLTATAYCSYISLIARRDPYWKQKIS